MQDANWIIEETKTASFGDKRLNKRYGHKRPESNPNKPAKPILMMPA